MPAPADMGSSWRPPSDATSPTSSVVARTRVSPSSTPSDSRRASCSPPATATPASWASSGRLASMEGEARGGAPPAIATERLTKHYGSVHALNSLSLEVRTGEIFGFLGPNGAGKSTTIRTLLGYLHATSGTARVLGLDVATESVAIRRRTGYLPGGIALYGSLSGEDDLNYLADLQGEAASRRAVLCARHQVTTNVMTRR